MKIYQLIYTSVKHSLSDSSKGLSNQSGLRVYSCSEGVTRENIQEITRFSMYPMPKKAATEYSKTPCDPSIPDKFPKIFRTLKLSDGRYAAIQIVYSGLDFKGDRGNYYAHALIFDETGYDFFPEQYYNSPLFTTYLTPEQQEGALVKYLPTLEEKRDPTLDDRVRRFIKEYRRHMEYLTERALDLLVSDELRNMCIATKSEEQSAMYLIALKYLLPRDISRYTGISTYNVSLPSDKQFNIVFHATVKGNNNITPELTKARSNCLYIDMDRTNFYTEKNLPIFDMDNLTKRYAQTKITSVIGFIDWCATYSGETKAGIGAKLLKLQQSAGDKVLRARLNEIYTVMDDLEHRDVQFELAKILYDNSEKLPSKESEITMNFITQCVNKMCGGEEYPISESCAKMTEAQAKITASSIRTYMKIIDDNYDSIPPFNKKALTEFFAIVKNGANKNTWRELFLNDTELLKTFVTMAAEQCIKGRGIEMFTIPKHWNDRDLSELVAYIDSSTDDAVIKRGCLKYIVTYQDEDWASYGVTIEQKPKTDEEEEHDLTRIKRMLLKVGYLPFDKGSYEHLKTDVRSDISDSLNPLLLSKVLNSYYDWRSSAGRQTVANDRAVKFRNCLLELREKERDVYNFIIPKLAIEAIEAPGHYHELIINTDTMPESFWDWFIIGYNRCKPDDNKLLIYHRIYLANKDKLAALPIGSRLREVFHAAV